MGAPAHDKAIAAILKWTQREPWRDRFDAVVADHLDPACEEFDIDPEELPEFLGEGAFVQLIGCALEDFLTCDFEPDEQNIVEDYLKRRGWKEPLPVKRYLQALRQSVMSLYEVVGRVPGNHFMARDLIRGGDPLRVEDKLGSQDLALWDRLAARLLPIGGRVYMAGGALRLSFDDASALLKEITDVKKRLNRSVKRRFKRTGIPEDALEQLPVDEAILGELAPVFTRTWLATMLQQAVGPPMPKVVNFDNEALVLAETRFPIADPGRSGEITARLDRLPDLVRDETEPPTWTWLATAPPGRSTPAVGAPPALVLKTYDEGGGRVLGSVRLEPATLVLQTNSTARAERGRTMLSEALDRLVGSPLTAIQTIEQALAERQDSGAALPLEEAPLPPEEMKEVAREMMDLHYRETLVTPLSLLDGKTPKQAVRSRAGRHKVAEWLKYLENQSAHHAEVRHLPPYDFSWMWEELGISDLRR